MLQSLISLLGRAFPPAMGKVDIEWFHLHAPKTHPLNVHDPLVRPLTEDGAGPVRERLYRDGIDRTLRGL